MYGVLLEAPTALIQLALPQLRERGGCVINISSVAGRAVPYPQMYLSVYAAAKGGINQLTRALAGELGPSGVRVNAISPGVSESEASAANGYEDGEPMRRVIAATPLGRLGRASDTAQVAMFLASDAAAWVTGQVVDASGGFNITP